MTNSGNWNIWQSCQLGTDRAEYVHKARYFHRFQTGGTVSNAVNMLNEGKLVAEYGYCIVYSNAVDMFFLLYDRNSKAEALTAIGEGDRIITVFFAKGKSISPNDFKPFSVALDDPVVTLTGDMTKLPPTQYMHETNDGRGPPRLIYDGCSLDLTIAENLKKSFASLGIRNGSELTMLWGGMSDLPKFQNGHRDVVSTSQHVKATLPSISPRDLVSSSQHVKATLPSISPQTMERDVLSISQPETFSDTSSLRSMPLISLEPEEEKGKESAFWQNCKAKGASSKICKNTGMPLGTAVEIGYFSEGEIGNVVGEAVDTGYTFDDFMTWNDEHAGKFIEAFKQLTQEQLSEMVKKFRLSKKQLILLSAKTGRTKEELALLLGKLDLSKEEFVRVLKNLDLAKEELAMVPDTRGLTEEEPVFLLTKLGLEREEAVLLFVKLHLAERMSIKEQETCEKEFEKLCERIRLTRWEFELLGKLSLTINELMFLLLECDLTKEETLYLLETHLQEKGSSGVASDPYMQCGQRDEQKLIKAMVTSLVQGGRFKEKVHAPVTPVTYI